MIGSQIGPYKVVRPLGQGGMGTVYEALNSQIDRRVAITVLRADLANQEEAVARFFNEPSEKKSP